MHIEFSGNTVIVTGGAHGFGRAIAHGLGAPADIAHAVLFFASDQASWITGQVLAVSGGR
jgi:NAD(P)-dependent dehydrogenase (short-subunit alcohol dehydrogenase family)